MFVPVLPATFDDVSLATLYSEILPKDAVVIDEPDGHSFAAHRQVRSMGEPLSSQPDRKGAALLAARGFGALADEVMKLLYDWPVVLTGEMTYFGRAVALIPLVYLTVRTGVLVTDRESVGRYDAAARSNKFDFSSVNFLAAKASVSTAVSPRSFLVARSLPRGRSGRGSRHPTAGRARRDLRRVR